MQNKIEEQQNEWHIYSLLPNLELKESYGNDYLALVQKNDSRLTKILNDFPSFANILNGFKDDYNQKINPAVLIFKTDLPKTAFNTDSICAFRNLFAISTLFIGWVYLNNYNPISVKYSEVFDFYPLFFGNDGSCLTETPAMSDFRSNDAPFQAEPFRGVPIYQFNDVYFDKQIYYGLLNAWEKRYIEKNNSKKINLSKIFRSLEFAYHSLSMPHKNLSITDVGINLSLWISAFETLSYPKTGDVKREHIIGLLNKNPLIKSSFKNKEFKYEKYIKKVRTFVKVDILELICNKLYDARNKFLHGDNISGNILRVFNKKSLHNNLYYIAPIIYRYLLFSFLFENGFISIKKKTETEDYFWSMENTINNLYNEFILKLLSKIDI